MKKIILAVILLAAAGGIAYYLLREKQNLPNNFHKKQILGTWKLDSLVVQKDSTKDAFALLIFALDTNAKKILYDFQKDGLMIGHEPVSSQKDTLFFDWGNENQTMWKEKLNAAPHDTMTIIKLDKKEFVLRSADSTLIYLKKVK